MEKYFMKKIYAVNGSPRKNGNTAIVLQHALEGAKSNGAETELIHLSDINFTGCRSCFACKEKNSRSFGKCAWQDGLTPVLEKLLDSDGIIMGTPIYFGGESSFFRAFIERLLFAPFQYTAVPSTVLGKSLPTAFVYTMNIPEEKIAEYAYEEQLARLQNFAGMVCGAEPAPEVLYVCDTYQFSDYSRYESSMFDAAHKAAVRAEQFPQDCRNAFELGKRMANK